MSLSDRWSNSRKRDLGILLLVLAVSPVTVADAVTFSDAFDITSSVEEVGSITESASPNWWVNSGGRFIEGGGVGKTIQGELPAADRWRLEYASSNPVDTDDGYHPQNIFRLVQRQSWTDLRQQVNFKIRKVNSSASPNRNSSNGVLLFNRYLDSQNLYYVGVRVDGAGVIKKKVGGQYFTLAYSKIFPGTYQATTRPNLLPENQTLGIQSRVSTNTDGSVTIQLWLDRIDGAGWQLMMEGVDAGSLGGPPITAAGYAGIRTDFMDVEFQSYSIRSEGLADDVIFANGF
jgi:hypothetical protein